MFVLCFLNDPNKILHTILIKLYETFLRYLNIA